MENFVVPVHLEDQALGPRPRPSARLAGNTRQQRAQRWCPCCGAEQQQRSAPTLLTPPKKRKRTSVARPLWASENLLVPRSLCPIPPEELPLASSVAPGPRPSTTPVQPDTELKIHNRSVEEYQPLYHQVVDNMLNFKNGHPRPFSIKQGRLIKQKLWEQLDRPSFTESVDEDGLVHVDMSYGERFSPPLYDIDISEEPQPETPPVKRRRK